MGLYSALRVVGTAMTIMQGFPEHVYQVHHFNSKAGRMNWAACNGAAAGLLPVTKVTACVPSLA